MNIVNRGRAGLGSSTTPRYEKAKGKERRVLVQEEVRASVKEEQASRIVGMQVTWAELWKAEPHRIKFLIHAIYDVLPSPNLFCWGKVESPACTL